MIARPLTDAWQGPRSSRRRWERSSHASWTALADHGTALGDRAAPTSRSAARSGERRPGEDQWHREEHDAAITGTPDGCRTESRAGGRRPWPPRRRRGASRRCTTRTPPLDSAPDAALELGGADAVQWDERQGVDRERCEVGGRRSGEGAGEAERAEQSEQHARLQAGAPARKGAQADQQTPRSCHRRAPPGRCRRRSAPGRNRHSRGHVALDHREAE